MPVHLLELSIGPVQGFIAAARRSRDLWAGSFILSELARAAGNALILEEAQLIYPVRPRITSSAEGDSNLSNTLLARIDGDENRVRAVAIAAQKAAHDRLKKFADTAWVDWSRDVKLRRGFWDRQIADAIETYAAWARIDGDDYLDAYERLKLSFAARKNTRDFEPMFLSDAIENGAGVPKCSFDGLRESVLPKRESFPARFGLSPGEQLDALGCIKRTIGRSEKFTALTRLAADGWLQRLGPARRQRLRDAYEPLAKFDLATRTTGNGGICGDFPFDGGLLYPERLNIAKAKAEPDATAALVRLETVLTNIWQDKDAGRPCPYAVLVVADGDRMGKFIGRAENADTHTKISDAIAGFADQVPEISRRHRGHCIYNGGEDLMVLFPLDGVVAGARDLAAAFTQTIASLVDQLPRRNGEDPPTLRVGAAICHVLEPLGVIRQWADAAEKFAKGETGTDQQGNALGIQLHVRSGPTVPLRIKFDDEAGFDALENWGSAYTARQLPGRLPSDTRNIAQRCRAIGASATVATAEFLRLAKRLRERGGKTVVNDELIAQLVARREVLAARHGADDPAGLEHLADELFVARWLTAVTAADLPNRQGAST